MKFGPRLVPRWVQQVPSQATVIAKNSTFTTTSLDFTANNCQLLHDRFLSAIMDPQDTPVERAPAPTRGPKPLQSSNPKTQYLILYNFVSSILWLVVLGRTLLLVPMVGFGRVYQGVGHFTKMTQTLACLEILHAATGIFPFSCKMCQVQYSAANI